MIRPVHIPFVNALQVGMFLRAVRRRRGLRQLDVGKLADISDATVSLVERGQWNSVSLGTIEKLASAVGVRLELGASWRGGDGGRLLSRPHSLLANAFAAFVAPMTGWMFEPEVSFSIYGERGVIDQLGWHGRARHLLVVELKTEFVDVNEALGAVDRKVRLARRVAAERGWNVDLVSCWLMVADSRTNRRHAGEHAALLRAKFPADGRQLRAFLRDPRSATFGLAFWPDSTAGGIRQAAARGKARIRVAGAPAGPRRAHEARLSPRDGRGFQGSTSEGRIPRASG